MRIISTTTADVFKVFRLNRKEADFYDDYYIKSLLEKQTKFSRGGGVERYPILYSVDEESLGSTSLAFFAVQKR